MNEHEIKAIVQSIQKQIWEAEYFVSINVNPTYWQARIDSYQFVLDHFRVSGISVSEITADMKKPVYDYRGRFLPNGTR